MPLQSSTVTEDFVFELRQFKQRNSVDRQRQTKYCMIHNVGEGKNKEMVHVHNTQLKFTFCVDVAVIPENT